MPLDISVSESESARFGLAVGRLVLNTADVSDIDLDDRHSIDQFDVVIMRYPHVDASLFARLLHLPNHEPLFADCLMYWRRPLGPATDHGVLPDGLSVRNGAAVEVEGLVRPIFDSYPSHYSANPLFSPTDVLEGYVEWVTRLVASGDAVCLVFEAGPADPVGFTIVDVSGTVPDVRFGGITPNHRGQGRYNSIIVGSMDLAVERGFDEVKISTQAHNLAVMSTWARQGWTPFESWTTVHLVRRGLLAAR